MDVVLSAVADAYMSVGVFVAALFAFFGWTRVRWGSRLEAFVQGHSSWGPVAAVVATLPPGCIGVLAISRLYVRGAVSYGTAIAALTSTMGDAAWLLLARQPLTALALKTFFAALGCCIGFTVDLLKVAPAPERAVSLLRPFVEAAPPLARGSAGLSESHWDGYRSPASDPSCFGNESEQASDDCHRDGGRPAAAFSSVSAAFWTLVAFSLLVTVPVHLRLVPEESFEGPMGALGVAGFLTCIAVFFQSRGRLVCGEDNNAVESSMYEVLRNGTSEAAFVTFWVAAVFAVWEGVTSSGVVDPGSLPLAGVAGVLIAAAAGLIPACGVEVLVSALFVSGTLPLPTLIAYLISQDGNGLIPIAARKPRAALHGMMLTTAAAMVVGLALVI